MKKKLLVVLFLSPDGIPQTRRKLAEENAMKKTQAAAMIVSYVNERMQEQEKASAAVNVALPGSAAAMTALLRQRSVCHPFYLLGLNPQTATVQAVSRSSVVVVVSALFEVYHLVSSAKASLNSYVLVWRQQGIVAGVDVWR